MSCSFTGEAMKSGHPPRVWPRLRRFRKDEAGAQLMEFAIVLPLMLLTFAVIVEGGRLMWSYQTVVSGVRDATRYLARMAPRDICSTGASVDGYTSLLETIVQDANDGTSVLPSGVRVLSVTPSVACPAGTFRSGEAPIVTVSAAVEVTFPFARLFEFGGGTRGTLNTSVTDQSRVFGS
jgi:Flp pilus assembly pilin Flp